jgi:hypothetical protein
MAKVGIAPAVTQTEITTLGGDTEIDKSTTEVPLIANNLLFVMEYCMLKFCEAHTCYHLVESLVLSATLAQGYPLGNLLALFLLVMVMLVMVMLVGLVLVT